MKQVRGRSGFLSLIVFGFVLILFLSFSPACVKKVGALPALPTACDSVTYTKDIKAILDSNCVYCHNGSPTSGGGWNYSTYSGIKQKADLGLVQKRVIDQQPSRMPPSSEPALSTEELNKISCWLKSGAKE